MLRQHGSLFSQVIVSEMIRLQSWYREPIFAGAIAHHIIDRNHFLRNDSAMSLDRISIWGDNSVMKFPEVAPVNLVRINPEFNMARFYGIEVQPTLFGEVSVLRNWGRIGTRGQSMMVTYEDADHAIAAFQKVDRQKSHCGYVRASA